MDDTDAGGPRPRDRLLALVVDDSERVRELIALNLRLEGLDVVMAEDGLVALELAVDAHPDVITLDVMMPRLDGFATVERLRADDRTKRIPVVLVTGRAQPADVARAEALGVEGWFSKPFEPADLVAAVRRLASAGRTPRRTDTLGR